MGKSGIGSEFTMRKSDGMRVHYKKSGEVRVHHEKKSNGVRVDHKKERWGESSL